MLTVSIATVLMYGSSKDGSFGLGIEYVSCSGFDVINLGEYLAVNGWLPSVQFDVVPGNVDADKCAIDDLLSWFQ